MTERIMSVGIDVGTTTTQMIVSRLRIENTASAFSVPRMEIRHREILYRGTIRFTPLLTPDTLDAQALRELIEQEYKMAGIVPQSVQTGAVIITGETARKENAKEVLAALAEFAGDFVVATAGPALESVLAARGAGADRIAKENGRYVLHMDIGGGTSNLALFDPAGDLVDTGCLNVGGRLMKFDANGKATYVSPVLQGMDLSDPAAVADKLAQVLEEAAGLREESCLSDFITDKTVSLPEEAPILSFSGGVADLIGGSETDWLRYGDLGVLLGRAIAGSRLCRGEYLLGRETIRATVIGAGSHATELSGSTISYQDVRFPLQNLPVVRLEKDSPQEIGKKLQMYPNEPVAISLTGIPSPTMEEVNRLAETIAAGVGDHCPPVVIAVETDMGKALGQALQLRLGRDTPMICLDGIYAPSGGYLDIAAPVGGGAAVPVIVKTLAFE